MGCYSLVSVEDHSLNLVEYGGANDKHRIVAQPFTEEQLQESKEQVKGIAIIKGVMNIGIGDVALRVFFPKEPYYSEDEQRMYDAMTLMTMGSVAFLSDLEWVAANTNETWEMIQPNDVPKIYINYLNGYQTVEELEADDVLTEYRINELTENFEGSDEERRAKAYEIEFEEIEEYRKEKMQPYVEKLGNCEIVNLPGGHFIHLEKPQECAEIIKEFIDGLN